MPPSLHFVLGFILGVLWTFGCFAVHPVAKIKLASLVAFPAIPMPTVLHVLILTNLAILNAIFIGPRLRSLGRLVKKIPMFAGLANPIAYMPALKPSVWLTFPTSVLNPTVMLLVIVYRVMVFGIVFIVGLIRAWAVFIWGRIPFVNIGIFNVIRIIARLRFLERLVKERRGLYVPTFTGFKHFLRPAFPTSIVHLTVAFLVILYRAAVFAIVFIVGLIWTAAAFIWDHIPFIVGLLQTSIPARGKTVVHEDGSVVDYDDETDITLVDESGPQSPSKDTIGSIFIAVDLPTKKSIVDVAEADPAPPPAPVSLNPSVPAFVPVAQPQVPSTASSGKPASFNVSAAVFMPKIQDVRAPSVDEDARYAGLSASMWAPTPIATLPVVPAKKPLVLRRAPPAFWSPGGCAIRIAAPSGSSS
ncbi:hypothetical protein C8R44DRAFT_927846 [Mycena epipterygia]|nr:hypothetical protein C8R44DRAFT_927846 [Mycena epipterygia]